MKLKIKSTKDGSFEGESGMVEYYYYRGENVNGELVEFGSTHEYDKGQDVDVNLIRSEIIDKKGRNRIVLKEAGSTGWE